MLLLLMPAAAAGRAQVRVGATAGTFAFAGATKALDPADPSTARPNNAWAWGAASSYQRGGWLVRLGVMRSEPGVVVGDDDIQVVEHDILGLLVAEPSLGRRLVTTGADGTLWVEAGAAIHRWTPLGEGARVRTGGSAALVWRQRAAGRLDLSVRAHASASPSLFENADLPPDLAPATLWRTGVSLELSWRL